MRGYPVDRVHHEVAFLGRNVHWTLAELLQLDHAQRRRWVAEVAGQLDGDLTGDTAATTAGITAGIMAGGMR